MSNPFRRATILNLVLLAALLVAACAPGSTPAPVQSPTVAAPAATAAPTEVATSAPTPTASAADDWAEVQRTGRLRVGTSADYPPFAYYNENFALDGFDVALIQEVGARLGIDVEIRDFAFEGLIGALQVNQIDVAIAAISITVERQAIIDFSDVYYVGEEAVLAREDSPIESLRFVEDLSDKSIGVERGSVYESWVEDNVIEPGLMPASNLLSFVDIGQAITSLREGRIDLVILDYLPARVIIQEGGVKQVGRSISRQQFGIAMRQGSSLLPEINRGLNALKDEDVVARLVETYLKLSKEDTIQPTPEPPTPTPAPTPTPEPAPAATATPTPEPPCVDGMQWVQDLSYDDRNMTAPPVLPPGQPFVKGWRVRNSGTCPWTGSYALTYVQGNRPEAHMNGNLLPIQGSVAPGALYDLQLPLVAPNAPGVYQGFWQMRNGQGMPFGERIWVAIQVPGAPTPTPAPTQTPSPSIVFYADRTNIQAGERVVFTWNVQNVREVYFYQEGQAWQNNGVAGQGSREVYPQATTVYRLRVVKPDGSVEEREIRIDVQAPPTNPPGISQFTVTPSQVQVGQCVDVLWGTYGDISEVTVGRDALIIWKGAPLSGDVEICLDQPGVTNFYVQVTGPGGSNRADQAVTVMG